MLNRMNMRTVFSWVGLLLLAACGSGGPASPPPDVAGASSTGEPDVEASEQRPVVGGARVRGAGEIVAVPGRPVRLCAPVPVALGGYLPGQEPAPQFCERGVDVHGVDLDALAHRWSKDGAIAGFAVLTGVWRDGALHVDTQERPPPAPEYDDDGFGPHRVQTPPCPAPAGGWPKTFKGDNMDEAQSAIDAFLAEHPEARDFTAFFRPGPEQVLLGVAVQNEHARADAERILRPVLNERLCIIKARYTSEQLKQAQGDPALRPGPPPHPIYSSGTGISDDIQPVYRLGVVMITEDLLAAAHRHPKGLVVFESTVVVLEGEES